MAKVPFLDLGWQHRKIAGAVSRGFRSVISRSAYIMGAEVAEFERSFARACGTRYCYGVANGTDALVLALRALGIGRGHEVLMPAHTFVADAEAVALVGATPVVVDIDPATRDYDLAALSRAVGPKSRAIIAVHLYGQPCDIVGIRRIARRRKLALIEDCAQAQGARAAGKPVGSWGDVAAFSFYPGKNLGAYGDAGAIVTNRSDVARQVARLRDHGSVVKYHHELVGYNSRLDTLQAVVLSAKLKQLAAWNRLRQQVARRYDVAFRQTPEVQTPPRLGDASVYHLYVVRVPARRRDALVRYLKERGIASGIHYPVPIHRTPAFRRLARRRGSSAQAEQLAAEIVSLPIYPGMPLPAVDAVAAAVHDFFHGRKR